MFDLSLSEILLVLGVAVLILKPEDVPVVMKTLGKTFRKIKNFSNDFFSSIMEDSQKPRTKKILGDDGKYYEAYSLEDVFEKNVFEAKDITEKDITENDSKITKKDD